MKFFTTKRRAISMIELIFAITIMGIVLMSVPNLIRIAGRGNYTALQQESVAIAASQLALVMTAAWDHNDTNPNEGMPILQTDSGMGGSAPLPNCTAANPPGVTDGVSGRFCQGENSGLFYRASAIRDDSGGADIDDYNGKDANFTIYNDEIIPTSQGDYVDVNLTIRTRVWYGDDTPRRNNGSLSPGGFSGNTVRFSNPFRTIVTTGTTHIKLISVELTSHNPAAEVADKNITLSAFMCNIGAPKTLRSNEGSL